jgi:hypothetical protein
MGYLSGTRMPNLYVKVTSANLASDANHMYRKNLNNTLSMFTMDEFINIISSQPMTVLKEVFSYERYTMGDVVKLLCSMEILQRKGYTILMTRVLSMKDMTRSRKS